MERLTLARSPTRKLELFLMADVTRTEESANVMGNPIVVRKDTGQMILLIAAQRQPLHHFLNQ